MSKYGLTRVSLVGDKTVIVAGPVPPHIAADAVSQEPVTKPEPLKRPLQKPNKPPTFVAPAKPVAQPAPAVKKEK